MARCKLCGQDAGWFKSVHAECERRHAESWDRMVALAATAARTGADVETLEKRLAEVAASGYRPEADVRAALAAGWERGINEALENSTLTEEEEVALVTYRRCFGLSYTDLPAQATRRLTLASALRDILAGKVPDLADVQPTYRLRRNEQLAWHFDLADYYEQRTRREYVGAYQGASIRVARGVYYRIGGFRGHPVEKPEMRLVDTGEFGIMTHHLYFAGPMKSLRIPYERIISLTPYTNGIGLHRDGANAAPQVFVTGDDTGWFVYNVVVNLSGMAR